MSKTRLLSGKIKKKSGVKLDGTRYEYLDVSQAEPDLGLPSTTGSVLISLTTGTRIWSPLLTVTDFVKVASTTQALSTDTGALVVTGGLGVGGDVWIGGTIHGGNLSGTAAASTTATNLIGGGPGQIPFQTASGVTGFSSNLTYNSSTGVLSVFNTTESTSTTTGALVISGGVGIGGNLYIAGEIVAQKLTIEYTTVTTTYVVTDDVITTTNPTQSDSTYTGALIVTGGVGIGGNTYIGGDLNVGGSLVITTASIAVYAPKTIITAGTDTEVSTSTGEISIWNISTLQSVTGRGNSTTNGISIIGEFGENSNTSTFNSVLSFDSSYSDIARGPNKIKLFDESFWQAGFGISHENLDIYSGYNTNFYQGTTADNIGHLSLSINSSSVVISVTSASISTNTGALQVTGGVGIGGDVNIGGAIYVNTEAYIGGALAVTSASLANYFVAGDDISITNNYDDLITISNTSTLDSITQRGSYTYQPIAINNTGSTISTDSGALTVAGGVGIGGDLYLGGSAILNTVRATASGNLYIETGSVNTWTFVFGTDGVLTNPGKVIIRSDEDSSSTTTGALQVVGGAGIGQNLYVKGSITAEGGFVGLNATSIYQNTSSVTVNDPGYEGQVSIIVADNTNTIFFANSTTFVKPSYFSDTTQLWHPPTTGTIYTTASVVIAGGAAVFGDLWVDKTLYSRGLEVITTATLGGLGVGVLYAGTDTVVDYHTGIVTIWNQSTLQSITERGATTTNAISITNETVAESTDTGALVVTGGVGVGGNAYIGGDLNVGGSLVITTASIASYAPKTVITAGTDTEVSTSTGEISVWNISTLQSVSDRGSTTSNVIHISNATSSTTSTDGAFIVDGGIGVAGDIRVGGNVYSQGGQPLYTPSVTLSPTPPAEPRIGDFWYDSNSFSYQYILDGTSTFWIQVGSTV